MAAAGRVVECLYCGHRIEYDVGAQMEPILSAAREHDKACPKSPLVERIRQLERENDDLCRTLEPYAKLAALSAGRPKGT